MCISELVRSSKSKNSYKINSVTTAEAKHFWESTLKLILTTRHSFKFS